VTITTTRVVSGEPSIPAAIGGFPTHVQAYDLGPYTIGLVSVRDLEGQLDREHLLRDETVVPPYWALVWSGARILAEHIAERLDCRGKQTLDVGCGLGLVALAAARKGAHVVAIDRELAPIEFLLASAETNRLEVTALVGDVTSADLGQRFDLLFAAELLYERSEFERLAEALVRLAAPDATIWIADAQRVASEQFYEALARRGFVVREVCSCDVREEATLVRVRLVALARNPRRAG
jgi:predicted nicotinamide N-methyase